MTCILCHFSCITFNLGIGFLVSQQVAESKLAKFVEDIIVPPRMIDVIVDGEVMVQFGYTSSFYFSDIRNLKNVFMIEF